MLNLSIFSVFTFDSNASPGTRKRSQDFHTITKSCWYDADDVRKMKNVVDIQGIIEKEESKTEY